MPPHLLPCGVATTLDCGGAAADSNNLFVYLTREVEFTWTGTGFGTGLDWTGTGVELDGNGSGTGLGSFLGVSGFADSLVLWFLVSGSYEDDDDGMMG